MAKTRANVLQNQCLYPGKIQAISIRPKIKDDVRKLYISKNETFSKCIWQQVYVNQLCLGTHCLFAVLISSFWGKSSTDNKKHSKLSVMLILEEEDEEKKVRFSNKLFTI